VFFFSSRRRHTRSKRDWSSDVCSSDLVVATAMPTIVGDLHGIDHYAWVFSAYLLATIASIPLWGRLADMIGRKPIFLSGMVIFRSEERRVGKEGGSRGGPGGRKING